MLKVKFKTKARTINLLGKDNILDHNSAIIEIVKNSYDARATIALIEFDENSIIILDNGTGMSFETIEKVFFTIGTDNKLNQPSEIPLNGSMGIGRLSLGALGDKVKIVTSDGVEANSFDIDWTLFNQNISLEDISFNVEKISLEDFVNYSNNYNLPINTCTGTFLIITDLKRKWIDDDKKNSNFILLEKRLTNLKSPYVDDDFKIGIKYMKEDIYYVDKPKKIVHDASVGYDYNKKTKSISLEIKFNEINLSYLNHEFVDKIWNSNCELKKYIFDDKGNLKSKYNNKLLLNEKELLEEMTKVYESLEEPLVYKEYTHLLSSIVDNRGEIFFTRRTQKTLSQPIFLIDHSFNSSSQRSEVISGISLYRDSFKIRPYGEINTNGFDWIGIEKVRSNNPAGVNRPDYIMNANQLSGFVTFKKEENNIFEDQANREGIKRTPEFDFFKIMLLIIIKKMSYLRHLIFKEFSDYEKNKVKSLLNNSSINNTYLKFDNLAKKNNFDISLLNTEVANSKIVTTENIINLYIKARNNNDIITNLYDEVDLLQSLSTQAISMAFFAHEIKNDFSFFSKYGTHMKRIEDYLALNYHINYSKIKTENNLQKFRLTSANKIAFITNFLNVTLRNPKRESRKKYNIKPYLDALFMEWKPLLDKDTTLNYRFNIKVENVSEEELETINATLTQLDSIFVNLLANSIKAFIKTRQVNRFIEIIISKEYNGITILYEDNGPGLDYSNKDISNNPNVIFEPFFTTYNKKYNTGLGLWIVSSVAQKLGWEKELPAIRGKFQIKFYI